MRRQKNARLVIGVASYAAGEKRRNTIMKTWGQDAIAHPEVDLVMMIGDPSLVMPKRKRNLLYLPCEDDYKSLPQKLKWFSIWALANTNAPWFFKCPDDIYIRVDRLLAITYEGWRGGYLIGCRGGRGTRANLSGGAGFFLSRTGAAAMAAYCTMDKGADDVEAKNIMHICNTRFRHTERLYYRDTHVPTPDNDIAACHIHGWNQTKTKWLHNKFK